MTGGTVDGEETIVKIEEIRTLSGNTPTITGSMYAWNQKGGISASSTGNMTGVYDLAGGQWERTASYVANENANLLLYGKVIAYEEGILKTVSTKYVTVYPHDSTIDNTEKESTTTNLEAANAANYIKNTKIYGDAIREISSTGIGKTSWENATSIFAGLYGPFIVRSGLWLDESQAGRFYFTQNTGGNHYHSGFRSVVIPIHV